MIRTHWKEIALQGAAEIGRLGRLLEDARTEIGMLKVSLGFSLEQSSKAARLEKEIDESHSYLDSLGALVGLGREYSVDQRIGSMVERVAQSADSATTSETAPGAQS